MQICKFYLLLKFYEEKFSRQNFHFLFFNATKAGGNFKIYIYLHSVN